MHGCWRRLEDLTLLILLLLPQELFVQFLSTKSYEHALYRNKRQIKMSDVTRTIQTTASLDWLREDFPDVKSTPSSTTGPKPQPTESAKPRPDAAAFFRPQGASKANDDADQDEDAEAMAKGEEEQVEEQA